MERFAREMARCYAKAPRWPEEELYSVIADALRVIGNTSKKYTDPTCVELSEDELEAENRRKMIEIFNGRSGVPGKKDMPPVLSFIHSRKELFKWLTTCFNNHTRGLVHRHRFTAKRTGSKVPPKGSPELVTWNRERQKPEVSLDANPEIRSRLEYQAVGGSGEHGEVDSDMEALLTPTEFLVFQQYSHPNAAALALATVDAFRGRNVSEVTLKVEHLSFGVGLSVQEFEAISATVRTKFDAYRAGKHRSGAERLAPVPPSRREALSSAEFLVYQQLTNPNQSARAMAAATRSPVQVEHLAAGIGMPVDLFQRLTAEVKTKLMDTSTQQNVAVAALEKIFDVQVPRSLPSLVIRRLFTLAARAQYEKVDENVATLLRNVGAEPPQVDTQKNLTCFGVLFSRNHHVCSACQARTACSAKAANFGLDQVTIAPSLLSARASVRTAEVIGAPSAPAPEAKKQAPAPSSPTSEREEEIRSYLEQHFKAVECYGENYYKHRAERRDKRVKHIVWVGERKEAVHPELNPRFCVRFCNPSVALQGKLVKLRGAFYAPESMSVKQVCELIAVHADRLFSDDPQDDVTVGQVCGLISACAKHMWVELVDGLRVLPLKRP